MEWRTLRYDDPRQELTPSELERSRGDSSAGTAMKSEDGRFLGVVAAFSLAPSQYATMVLREVTRVSSARDVQSVLSAEHDKQAIGREDDDGGEEEEDGQREAKRPKLEQE